MRPALRVALLPPLAVLVVLIGLSGCQYRYPVEVYGEIRSAADGTALRGVRVELSRASGLVYSEPDGSFVIRFKDDWRPGEVWQLSLSRDDFNPESVLMTLRHGPTTSGTTQVFVFVSMRPKAP